MLDSASEAFYPNKEPLLELVNKNISILSTDNKSITIPVSLWFLTDTLTPFTAYLRLAENADNSFLLQSGNAKIQRRSYIGTNAKRVVATGAPFGDQCDPLIDLEANINSTVLISCDPELPEFCGGAVGYIGYDCIKYFEPKTYVTELKDVVQIPESVLMYTDSVVAFDHILGSGKIIKLLTIEPELQTLDRESFEAAILNKYAQIKADIYTTFKTLTTGQSVAVQQPTLPQEDIRPFDPEHIDLTKYESNIGREGYHAAVKKLKEHIKAGDIFQAVPSQRLVRNTLLNPLNLYQQLCECSPSPYLFYLDFGKKHNFVVMGASPECLVQSQESPVDPACTEVITHPIAGTIRRGKTKEEDAELAQILLNSAKDRAEHIMLVDLARNDVNRVCEPTKVHVTRLMQIEPFSHVMHIVSEVKGGLMPSMTTFDAFRSIFPAGTVSGAPKIKAMQLIGEIEREKRGLYAGALGFWTMGSQSMNTCIALRSIVYKDGKCYLQAGGGIVFDSDEEEEYIETLNKLKAAMTAIELAERRYVYVK